MYQALYRKWRPQTFDQVIGQQHITETLKNQVVSGRLSHAYIFIGTRGTGKTTCARILAKAVNCEHPVNGNPCCECASCRGIQEGSVLDIVELDAASNNGVDSVRALREEAVFSPASVRKRVYIIDEVHMLSISAFNALLKILEEPPEHLMFILATTELQKVPATILSRCQRHSFKRIVSETLAEYLQFVASQEAFTLTPDAADLIARLAEGGVRDSLSLLDQCSAAETIDADAVYNALGLAGNRAVGELLEQIIAHNTQEVLVRFHEMWMNGKDPASLLSELNSLLRDILMVKVAAGGAQTLLSGGFESKVLKAFAARLTVEELLCCMDKLRGCIDSMRTTKSPKLAAELCFVSLCSNTLFDSPAELSARISRLEQELDRAVSSGGFRITAPERTEEPYDEHYEDELPPPPPPVYEYEDLGPEVFIDEPREAAPAYEPKRPAAPAPKKEMPVTEAPKKETGAAWNTILDAALPKLPTGVQKFATNENDISGYMLGNVLHLQVTPGFKFGQINRQNVLAEFAHAASVLTGQQCSAVAEERKQEEHSKYSIDSLRKHEVMDFID